MNDPDHVFEDAAATGQMVRDCGLQVSGLAMRFYTDPGLDRGIDAARAMGAPMMTLGLGQDGWDHAFHFRCEHPALWSEKIEGIAEVAAHDRECLISIEY